MKIKRSIFLPAVLLVYLAGIAIYAWPGRQHQISYTSYWMTIGVTLVSILLLTYFLRKRDKIRDENRKNKTK